MAYRLTQEKIKCTLTLTDTTAVTLTLVITTCLTDTIAIHIITIEDFAIIIHTQEDTGNTEKEEDKCHTYHNQHLIQIMES